MTAPWTPRERQLRAALWEYRQCQRRMLDLWSDSDQHGKEILWRNLHRCEALADTALSTAPPPDPRDEALHCTVCHGTGIERSGVCHCGAEMDGHSVYDNHGALEMVRPCEFCTTHIQSKLTAATDALNDAKKAFEAIQFECDGKADVEDDDSGIANRPNLAMRVELIADKALAAIAAVKGEK